MSQASVQIQALIERDGDLCHWCRRAFPIGHTRSERGRRYARSRDHLIPRSRGGRYVLENLVLACHECNTTRGDTPWRLWQAAMDLVLTERPL